MLNKIFIEPSKQKLIVYLILIAVTLAVYWQVNHYDFINLDDPLYVIENSHIKSGITPDGFRWAFVTRHAQLWHPLVWLSFMADYQLYGLNAGGYHLTNIILHVLSTLLLFWFLNRMTGSLWKSAFTAAFFAFHPLHVESVAWVSERKDVLSAFFWMLTLCSYVYYTEKPVIQRYLLVIFSYILALLSKPMVVTLPVIMILLDYWPLGRFQSEKINWFWGQLKEKAPFFILSAIVSAIALYNPDPSSLKPFPLSDRIANAPIAFVTYLTKTFWPADMAIFYPFPAHISLWQALGASLLILVISAAVVVLMKRLPYLFVGWMWFAVALLPVNGIIQIQPYAMADHYHYLPAIGIAIMLFWGIPALFPKDELQKYILFPAAVIVMAVFLVLTWHQCGYWKNSISMYSHALQVTKNNYWVHINYGAVLFSEGEIGEAFGHYNEAIRLKPDESDAYNNRGAAYANLEQYQKAFEDFNESIRLNPDNKDSAIVYNNRGSTYARLGQYQKAIEDLNSAIYLKPDYANAYYKRGLVYKELGQYQRAVNDLSEAIHLKQDYAEYYDNRAIAYFNTGKVESGCRDAKKSCELGNCPVLQDATGKGLCR